MTSVKRSGYVMDLARFAVRKARLGCKKGLGGSVKLMGGMESLEPRTMLSGNLAMTNLQIVDGKGAVIAAPVAGQSAFLKATFTADASFSAPTTAKISFTINGVTSVFDRSLPIASAIYSNTLSFELKEGSNSFSATIDSLNTIAESNEADNSFTLNMKAADPTPFVAYNTTFTLHSNPTATKKIYLDFNGHTTTGMDWNKDYNGGKDIVTPAFDINGDASTFSNYERYKIQETWLRVAEDYAPFDVDVTTQDPGVAGLSKSNGADTSYGVRVVIGGSSTDWFGDASSSGVAYLDTFTSSLDLPVFVFQTQNNDSARSMAASASHEVGHTLNLHHDGRISPAEEYFFGNGTWSPLMGVGATELSQWSKGEYASASNTEDDLAVITSHGLSFRADDKGNTIGTAGALTVTSSTAASAAGIISTTADVDFYSLTLGAGGHLNLSLDEAVVGANLDILAKLFSSDGKLVATSNSTSDLGASFSVDLAAGTYYVSVDGTGQGDPALAGYSDYGSLGAYAITAGLTGGAAFGVAPTITSFGATANPEIGSLGSITVTFSSAINTSSFNFTSMTLTRDGGANLVNAVTGLGLSLSQVSGTTYTINGLASLTGHVGTYTLTVLDGGVTDTFGTGLDGNGVKAFSVGTAAASAPVLNDASEGQTGSGYTNTATPTVVGTATAGATVEIFEAGLSLGTGIADLTGHYSITLSTLSVGNHTIKAVATSPTNTAADSANSVIVVETAIPTVVSMSTFASPRTIPVLTLGVRMSSLTDLTTLTWADIMLTRNGGANIANSGITITPSGGDPKLYTITLPASLANPVGNYSLTVNGAGVQNLAGSTVSNSKTTTWSIIAATPSAPTLDVTSEGKVGSGFTGTTTPTMKGTGSAGSTVEIFVGATLKGSGVVGADGKYLITLSALSVGVHTLKARATDGAGTITGFSADSTITVETAIPTIVNMSTYAAPRTVPVGASGIRFSSQIDLSTFTSADILLTRNGVTVSTSGVTLTVSPTDNKLYTIVIPPASNTPDGVYVLQVLGSGIKNLAGKTVSNNFSTTWTTLPQIMNMSVYTAPRTAPVTVPGIRFSNPITLNTFTFADITLRRNGGANLATSAITIAQSASDPSVYTILIPSSLTNTAGTYVLTVTGAGIGTPNGFTISNNMSTTWTQL
jgi:hypothetical protein